MFNLQAPKLTRSRVLVAVALLFAGSNASTVAASPTTHKASTISAADSIDEKVSATSTTPYIWENVGPTRQRMRDIAMSSAGNVAYAVSDYANGVHGAGRLFKSTPAEVTWSIVDDIPVGYWRSVTTSATGSVVAIIGIPAALPDEPANLKVLISTDGGTNWVDHTPILQGGHTLKESIDVTADGTTFAVATTAGPMSYTSNYGWNLLISSSVNKVAIGKEDGEIVFVHAIDQSGVYTWFTGIVTVGPKIVLDSSGGLQDIDTSDNGQKVIAVSDPNQGNAQTHVSTDAGATWGDPFDHSAAQFPPNQMHTVAISRDGSRYGVVGYNGTLQESTNDGTTWTASTSGNHGWLSVAYSSTGSKVLGAIESLGKSVITYIPTPAPNIQMAYVNLYGSEAPTTGIVPGRELEILIFGAYFYDFVSLTIGGTEVAELNVLSSTMISSEIPPGTEGAADVVLRTEYGTYTYTNAFRYFTPRAPSVTATSSATGPRDGVEIVIEGLDLDRVTEVRFGDRIAEITDAVRDYLVVIAPTNRVGLMDISITNDLGTTVFTDAWTSEWSASSDFSTPLTVVSHSTEHTSAGFTVTVKGTGFTARTDATIDNRPVNGLQIISDTELRFSATRANANRNVVVYGDINFVEQTVVEPAVPQASPPETQAAPVATLKTNRPATMKRVLRQLEVSIPRKAKVTAKVRTPRVCAISKDLKITGLKKGTCKIRVTFTPLKGKPTKTTITVQITK